MDFPHSRSQRLFWIITAWRWPIVVLGLAALLAAGSFLPQLKKDTSADAFIDPENPALVYHDKIEAIFGLSDPIVVAVVNDGPDGIYNPQSLALVRWLTERIERMDNVDPERVVSLATESHIVGTSDGMVVEAFFDRNAEHFTAALGTQDRADEIRHAVEDFPLYQGSLVARDGSATIIVAELMDEDRAQATYNDILALSKSAPAGGDTLHVAGDGAVAGYLNTYIDQDARRLNPIAGIVITLIVVLAFLSVRGAVLPNLIVLATVGGTFSVMAAVGVDFYVITNGLIVNLIGIAVADSIHILSQYYEDLRDRPDASQRELVVRAMTGMWRPVTLTTLTTAAGFLAVGLSASMPPIRYFGLFGALGLVIAWAYSMTVLPAVSTWWPKKLSRPFRGNTEGNTDLASRFMIRFGHGVLARPYTVLAAGLVIAVVGTIGLSRVVINDARIENFQSGEPIYRADKVINRTMDGIYYLDVMVETPNKDGLHNPNHLRRIERLQAFLETLPHVAGSTSIADIIKQMHKAVNENRSEAYRIPDDPFLIAQLFLLYNASGDPTDLEEEIDHDHRRALVRANVDRSNHLNNQRLIPAVERYLESEFNSAGITGTANGRVNVDYEWIDGIADSHMRSVLFSFAAVLLIGCVVFRSLAAGLLATLPVALAVLLVYAVMGFGSIWLGVGTSMFAAIAIGLGVDFAIHTVDRLRDLVRRHGFHDETILRLYPTTGRALLFNFLAVTLGFGVLLTSDVPPLVRFGTLVAVAVSTAFLGAMTIVPALVKLTRPAFLFAEPETPFDEQTRPGLAGKTTYLVLVVSLAGALVLAATPVIAQELPSGRAITEKVNDRNEGRCVSRDMTLDLTDRSGTTRVQQTRSFRCYFGEEKRTAIFYTEPANIKDTAFLTYDYSEPDVDDDQWLYLPALRKVRRISASDRGDYFLGTDFSYEEVKKENKVEISDYTYTMSGTEQVDGHETYVVEGTPVNESIAEELGYSRVVWRVDPVIWMSRKSDYWDINGNHLKTIHNRKIEKIEGIWTAVEIHVENHKSGHSTRLTYSDIDYKDDVPARMFEQTMLRRGL